MFFVVGIDVDADLRQDTDEFSTVLQFSSISSIFLLYLFFIIPQLVKLRHLWRRYKSWGIIKYTHDTTKISNILITGPIGPALIKLSIPIIFANILQSGYQLTDAFWVRRLGEKDIEAVAISFPVIFLVIIYFLL